MKVLFIAHSSKIQGSGKSLLTLVIVLITLGVEVKVALPGKGPLYDKLVNNRVKTYNLPLSLSIYPELVNKRDIVLFLPRLLRMILNNLFSFCKLFYLVGSEKPDLIHTNVGPIHIGSRIARIFHIPHIWHIREYQYEDFRWNPFPSKANFYKKIHSKNNHIISITKSLFQHFNMSSIKDYVVYNGVMDNNYLPEIRNKKKCFLFVGNVSKSKGIDEILRAFIEISHIFPDYNLLIVGKISKNCLNNINKIIDKSALFNRVLCLGFLDDVNLIMAEATAIIIASQSEGFGRVTAEAMYNGCLVIGKNLAGTKEQFDNGLEYCGKEIGIRYSNYEELVNSMKTVCSNGIDYYLSTIRLAQETVKELYSIEKYGRRIFEIYNNILGKDCEFSNERNR